jgi:hypothetical protein
MSDHAKRLMQKAEIHADLRIIRRFLIEAFG